MLSSDQNPERSAATGDDSSNTAGQTTSYDDSLYIKSQPSFLPHPHFKKTGIARPQVAISCLPSGIS